MTTAVTAIDAAIIGLLRRAALYQLLAGAFCYPMPARVEELRRLATVLADAPPTGALAAPLARFAAAVRGADTEALAAEHVLLFDREVRCPPYEGAYGPVQVTGKAAQLADIAGFYRAFDLQPAEWQPDTEDHIGAELEFMAALALKEAWALSQGEAEHLAVTRDAQAAFLTDHLGGWAEAFAERLATTASPAYYKEAAALLSAWLATEIEALGVVPRKVGGTVETAEAEPLSCPMAREVGWD